MHEYGTIKELFDVCLAAEKEAMDLYLSLSEKFGAHEKARKFFSDMAAEEGLHISGIEGLMGSLTEEELDRLVPPETMIIVKNFLRFSAEQSGQKIETLDDALRAVVNFEFSEANKIHELVYQLGEVNAEKKEALKRTLKGHQDKVIRFRNSITDPHFRP